MAIFGEDIVLMTDEEAVVVGSGGSLGEKEAEGDDGILAVDVAVFVAVFSVTGLSSSAKLAFCFLLAKHISTAR